MSDEPVAATPAPTPPTQPPVTPETTTPSSAPSLSTEVTSAVSAPTEAASNLTSQPSGFSTPSDGNGAENVGDGGASPAAPDAPDTTTHSSQPADIAPTGEDVPSAEKPETTPVVEQPSSTQSGTETAATPEQSVSAPVEVTVVPAAVLNGVVYRGRSDDDVLTGGWCTVIAGEHQGRYGVYTATATVLQADGWPATVTVRTRDARDEDIVVSYADIRPAQAGGR